MATTQTVLFTVMPRGLSINGATLPVSVVVSPRLLGSDSLGAYPDWLDWTQKVKGGFQFTFKCGTQTAQRRDRHFAASPRSLAARCFNASTFVRSRKFDDYSSHGVMSFSVRESLSALKAVYQEASVVLALPDPADESDPERSRRRPASAAVRRGRPIAQSRRDMLKGLDVHWNKDNAKRWRGDCAASQSERKWPTGAERTARRRGLITAARNPSAFQSIAGPFTAYHHMPTPTEEKGGEVKVDPDSFDFHQALSALEAHPELQRALGLVFDLELPKELVPLTAIGALGQPLGAVHESAWQMPPASHPLETACVHLSAGDVHAFLHRVKDADQGGAPLQIFGLLNLDPARFGLAQVDVDGAMHKVDHDRRDLQQPGSRPQPAARGPGSRAESGGVRSRSDAAVDALGRPPALRRWPRRDACRRDPSVEGVQPGARIGRLAAATVLRRRPRAGLPARRVGIAHATSGTRCTGARASTPIGESEVPFATEDEEGFFQLAATQPAPGAEPADKDLYVHEVIARWAGWSLSVPFPGKALSRYGDPEKAIPIDGDDPDYRDRRADHGVQGPRNVQGGARLASAAAVRIALSRPRPRRRSRRQQPEGRRSDRQHACADHGAAA